VSFQRDYVLRVIEAFARAMAAIVALRKGGQAEQARQELDRAARQLIGADLSLIDAVGLDAVVAQLDGREKLEQLACLLEERSEQEAARGGQAAAARWAARAGQLRRAGARPG
jgi:hypothetical protein